MEKRSLGRLVSLLLAALLLSACGAPGGVQAAPEPVTAETPAPTAAPEPTPEPTPTPAPTPTPPAEQLPLVTLEGRPGMGDLLDGDYLSYLRCQAGEELRFAAEAPVAGIYLVWYEFPQPYELRCGDAVLTGGESGFLHEFIRFPAPSESFSLCMPEESGLTLCDIYAFSEGLLPDWVQCWEPPCETADLLLFSTHADDEYIFFGGIIPDAVDKGLAVQLVYMTSHYEGSERHRCHEKLNGLWTAGVRHYPVTNPVRDYIFETMGSAAGYYGEDAFIDFQVEQLRRFRPLVVVSHDEEGEYGHPVHQLTAHCLKIAVEEADDPARDPASAERYGLWDTPKLYLHLYGDEPTILDHETPLASFGGRSAREVALEAYAQHLSQQVWQFTVYDFDSPYDSHRFGLVRSLVGEDEAKNDLMEHIDPAAWRG